jgi:hypothetical protein
MARISLMDAMPETLVPIPEYIVLVPVLRAQNGEKA